jgi:hypothetical protein
MSGADKPWQGLDFELHEDAEKIFKSCSKHVVGNGERFKFWTDRWLNDSSVEDLVPNLMNIVKPVARKTTVAVAMQNNL